MLETTQTEDDSSIRSLIGLAALTGDVGEPEDYRRIYSPNATWRSGQERQTGADEIVAAAAARRDQGISGPGTATRHFVVPLHVTVSGDRATAVSYFAFLTATTSAPTVSVVGTYRDELVRTEDGWRIHDRETTIG